MDNYFENMIPADELAQLNYIPTIPDFVTWIEEKWGDLPALSDTVNKVTYKQMCERIARRRALLVNNGPVKILGRRSELIVDVPFRLDPPVNGMNSDYINEQTLILQERMKSLMELFVKRKSEK